MLNATRLLQAQTIEWGRWAGALGNMGVDFCGFDAAVAQQIPDDAGTDAGLHEVGSVGMAQHVQRNRTQDASPAGGLLHHHLQAALAVGFAGVLTLEQVDYGAMLTKLLAEQEQQGLR